MAFKDTIIKNGVTFYSEGRLFAEIVIAKAKQKSDLLKEIEELINEEKRSMEDCSLKGEDNSNNIFVNHHKKIIEVLEKLKGRIQ